MAGKDSGTLGPVAAFLQPYGLAVLATAASLGIAYAAMGAQVNANADDIAELRTLTIAVGRIQVRQATADAERDNIATDVNRILRILEARYGPVGHEPHTPKRGPSG